ncbi:MAG: hypothetical protein HY064_11685 [Bacteroidetes bacterium]|nr:hypothetical protein [Bacteroidota bacterium]
MSEGTNTSEPFFHESENFSSAYFGKVPAHIVKTNNGKVDQQLVSSLVAQLTDPNLKETREDVLRILRDGKAQQLLIGILSLREFFRHRAALVRTCWETGLDFSEHLELFVHIATDGNYSDCIESMTVIVENMNGPFNKEQLERSITLLEKTTKKKSEQSALLEMIFQKIKSF